MVQAASYASQLRIEFVVAVLLGPITTLEQDSLAQIVLARVLPELANLLLAVRQPIRNAAPHVAAGKTGMMENSHRANLAPVAVLLALVQTGLEERFVRPLLIAFVVHVLLDTTTQEVD